MVTGARLWVSCSLHAFLVEAPDIMESRQSIPTSLSMEFMSLKKLLNQ